jgi:hypothetical protein
VETSLYAHLYAQMPSLLATSLGSRLVVSPRWKVSPRPCACRKIRFGSVGDFGGCLSDCAAAVHAVARGAVLSRSPPPPRPARRTDPRIPPCRSMNRHFETPHPDRDRVRRLDPGQRDRHRHQPGRAPPHNHLPLTLMHPQGGPYTGLAGTRLATLSTVAGPGLAASGAHTGGEGLRARPSHAG